MTKSGNSSEHTSNWQETQQPHLNTKWTNNYFPLTVQDHLYKQLQSLSGMTPLLYGLLKIHKPEIPLRPIASFINSPSYQLSKHLVHLLSPLVRNTSSFVKNSTEFAAFISDQIITDGAVLVSFDVVSLFTNVPVELACQVAGVRLHADDSLCGWTALSPDEIPRLLRFCLNATSIAYQGEWYQQTLGTAMGSPVSVTVANVVKEDVEERALASFPTPPPSWKRFVDDTCTASLLNSFHSHLNSIESSIEFTYEMEDQQKLPFLDLLIKHHLDGTLSTTVYRKKTHTDKQLDFQSHHLWPINLQW